MSLTIDQKHVVSIHYTLCDNQGEQIDSSVGAEPLTYLHGAGKYGLQCLTGLEALPETGALIFAAPLKILEGSGSPLRVLALVPAPA
mgnify:CR=1 FL=1